MTGLNSDAATSRSLYVVVMVVRRWGVRGAALVTTSGNIYPLVDGYVIGTVITFV